jgi:hypothetical protein
MSWFLSPSDIDRWKAFTWAGERNVPRQMVSTTDGPPPPVTGVLAIFSKVICKPLKVIYRRKMPKSPNCDYIGVKQYFKTDICVSIGCPNIDHMWPCLDHSFGYVPRRPISSDQSYFGWRPKEIRSNSRIIISSLVDTNSPARHSYSIYKSSFWGDSLSGRSQRFQFQSHRSHWEIRPYNSVREPVIYSVSEPLHIYLCTFWRFKVMSFLNLF